MRIVMSKYFRQIILSTGLLLALLLPAVSFSPIVYGDTLLNGGVNDACTGVGLGANACSSDNSGSHLNGIIKGVVQILSYIIGIVAVIVIIIQGFRFITSGGDPNTITSARNAILYAVVGIILAIAAQLIVHYVIGTGTKS